MADHPRFSLPPGDPRTQLLDAAGRRVTPTWFEETGWGTLVVGRYVLIEGSWREETWEERP